MTYRSSNRKLPLRVTEKLRKLESVEETTENKVNENDYLLKLNRRVVKLSRTVFFNVAKLVLLVLMAVNTKLIPRVFSCSLLPSERDW